MPVTIRVWCWTMSSEGFIDNNDSLILVTERKRPLIIVHLLRRIRVQNSSLFSFFLLVYYSNNNVSLKCCEMRGVLMKVTINNGWFPNRGT